MSQEIRKRNGCLETHFHTFCNCSSFISLPLPLANMREQTSIISSSFVHQKFLCPSSRYISRNTALQKQVMVCFTFYCCFQFAVHSVGMLLTKLKHWTCQKLWHQHHYIHFFAKSLSLCTQCVRQQAVAAYRGTVLSACRNTTFSVSFICEIQRNP